MTPAPPSLARAAPAAAGYRFHRFELVPLARSLTCDGRPVRLSSRAFDVLVCLVENAGTPLSKQQLMAHVWPSTIVEEVNLRVQMSALRKVLDAGRDGLHYIDSVPGRGYNFVAPVVAYTAADGAAPMRPDPHLPRADRPGLTAPAPWLTSWARPVLGRAGTIAGLVRELPQRRLQSIVGPAGVGKTVVAREVAGRLAAQWQLRVCLVDLGGLGDGCSVIQALAAALGLPHIVGHEPGHDGAIGPLLRELRRRRTLLLFDSVECRRQETAALATQLLLCLPELWMLATGREPLLARGETLHRLAPFSLPASAIGLTADAALDYPAIQLFCERAMARRGDFLLRDRDVGALVELCRRLDGLPLAIELAAARSELFTIAEILAQMDYRFHLLADGRRTGLQRHRTMWDALDWGVRRLPAQEQIVLRRLSVFQGGFSLDCATDAVSCVFVPDRCVPQVLASLVAKSLLAAEADTPGRPYRLLNSTRAYADEKLRGSLDEQRFPARWHPRPEAPGRRLDGAVAAEAPAAATIAGTITSPPSR
ncbi:winged helix-turn-helix domain-containing protein [Rugamonas sp.]|uniref:ATP-binding protein n=1 Tax=Rugamonas sp. TaxID=1926287 RepID=UPI0025ED4B20|nr:winged helix-turn-helix domain-containing protein [Rugamonas sp.]